jgi:hypothetical protein
MWFRFGASRGRYLLPPVGEMVDMKVKLRVLVKVIT